MADGKRYHNELDDAAWATLLAEARAEGWERAAWRAMHDDEHLWQVVADPCRHDWVHVSGLARGQTVLELGAGHGGLTVALAGLGCRVVAADLARERLDFLALRLRQEAPSAPVAPLCADALDLPLRGGVFDAVTMVGVLEWVAATGRADEAVTDVQVAALAEAARVLRPGGRLYVAIENRRGAKYREGADDDHVGVPGVTGADRAEADRLARFWTSRPYRTWTYDHGDYGELLDRAGLRRTRTLLPLPDYKHTKAVVPADGASLPAVRALCAELAADPYLDHWHRVTLEALARAETPEDLLRDAACFLLQGERP